MKLTELMSMLAAHHLAHGDAYVVFHTSVSVETESKTKIEGIPTHPYESPRMTTTPVMRSGHVTAYMDGNHTLRVNIS